MAGKPKWHKFNYGDRFDISRHYKIKDKKYARPLILTHKEFLMFWWIEIRACNPNKTDEEIKSFFED